MPPKIIFVGGVPASGKSTAAQAVAERLNQESPGQVELVESGTELRKAAQEVFGKDINSLNKRQLAKIRTLLYQRVVGSKANVVLFVHHFTFAPKTSAEQRAIIQNKLFSSILLPHIRHFVLIESPLKTVKLRRIIESENKPRPVGEEDIRRSIVSERLVARATAREQRKPLAIVSNKGQVKQSARQIERIVRLHL